MWPDAQKLGISRATFDNAARGLEPDLSLPDLSIPGRVQPPPGQPEFVQTPADYLKKSSFTRLTERGRKLREQYRDVFARIEKEFGVPGPVVLAIWGRESDYSTHYGGRDAIQMVATQAYTGRRKDLLPRPAPLGAEDAAGRRAAQRDALVLGRRHGADPVPAVGVLQVRRRFRRRRQGRHLDVRCPTRWPRPPSSWSARAGSATSRGPTRCACRPTSTARSPIPTARCRCRTGSSAVSRSRMAARRRRAISPSRPRCCCRPALMARAS